MASKFLNLSTDTTLGGNSPSDDKAVSEKAIKTYVDSNSGGLPSQTGHAGDILTTDGTDASWGDTAEIIPIIETYSNGTSFYRIWAADSTSYRYCVQGSTYYKGSTIAGNNTVEFLKEFTNTNYSLTVTPIHSDTNLSSYTLVEKYPSRTTAQATVYSASAAFGYSWVARGYIKDDV